MVKNSTSINKTDNYLSSQNIEYKQTMTYTIVILHW